MSCRSKYCGEVSKPASSLAGKNRGFQACATMRGQKKPLVKQAVTAGKVACLAACPRYAESASRKLDKFDRPRISARLSKAPPGFLIRDPHSRSAWLRGFDKLAIAVVDDCDYFIRHAFYSLYNVVYLLDR